MRTADALAAPGPLRSDAAEGSDRVIIGAFVVFAAAVFLLPDRYTVPLGPRIGLRPHQLIVVVVAVMLLNRFLRGRAFSVGRPACIAGLLVVALVASMVVNHDDLSNATYLGSFRLIVTTVFNVALAVIVGLLATTPRRRRFVVGVVVSMIAVASLFAIVEAQTAEPIRLDPIPPGLVEERTLADQDYDGPPTVVRNGVPRPAGLSANALELSAVMALGLPFAVYLAFSADSRWPRLWYLTCSVLIAVAVVLSISRTGMLAVTVIGLVALAANLRRPKVVLIGLGAVVVLGATVAVLVPESVDATLRQFGKDGNEDPSLATRLQDYEELDNLLGPYPWFGRGPNAVGTYAARDGGGLVLDNQYLLLIAEVGVLGLAALLVLLASTGATAVRRARGPTTERGLWVAAVGAVAAVSVMGATFDVLRFAQVTALFMVIVGLVSATEPGLRSDELDRALERAI